MSMIFWKDLMPSQKESETAKACMSMLKQRLDGKITEEEFEKEMHYVTLLPDCLRDHEFKEAPPKTVEVSQANEILDMAAFHKAHPCLLDYSEKLEGNARLNQRNAQTLEEHHAYFTRLGDTLSAMKIQEVYRTYPPSIWVGNSCVWKRRIL